MTCDIWWLWLLLLWTNPFILFEVLSIPGTILPPGYSLWLFSYKPFYVVSLRRPTMACLLFLLFISPLCGVAETPDYGTLVNYFHHKSFMWCRSGARLWHAVIYLPYEPFMRCRSDARLRHARYLLSFRGIASDTRSVHFITTLLLHIHVVNK